MRRYERKGEERRGGEEEIKGQRRGSQLISLSFGSSPFLCSRLLSSFCLLRGDIED